MFSSTTNRTSQLTTTPAAHSTDGYMLPGRTLPSTSSDATYPHQYSSPSPTTVDKHSQPEERSVEQAQLCAPTLGTRSAQASATKTSSPRRLWALTGHSTCPIRTMNSKDLKQ